MGVMLSLDQPALVRNRRQARHARRPDDQAWADVLAAIVRDEPLRSGCLVRLAKNVLAGLVIPAGSGPADGNQDDSNHDDSNQSGSSPAGSSPAGSSQPARRTGFPAPATSLARTRTARGAGGRCGPAGTCPVRACSVSARTHRTGPAARP